MRKVEMTVPAGVANDDLRTAMTMGLHLIDLVRHGGAAFIFPKRVVTPDGVERRSVGVSQTVVLDDADVDRFVALADATTDANTKILQAQASGVAADVLTAQVLGKRQKDNAASVAKGNGGIIAPR